MQKKKHAAEGPFERLDWKDPAAYAHLRDASLTRLAWEFLRRNPDYGAKWLEFIARAESLDDGQEEMVVDPAGDGGLLPLTMLYGRPWGLDHMVAPSVAGAKFIASGARIELPMSGRQPVEATGDNPFAIQQKTKWLVFRVDLSLPLNVIEAAALGAIRGERRRRIDGGVFVPVKSRALATARYIEYLRVLDAAAAGASLEEMVSTLKPKAENVDRQQEKRLRAALVEAKRLQADGYATLPLLQPWREVSKKI